MRKTKTNEIFMETACLRFQFGVETFEVRSEMKKKKKS
jgi:hypothetical protein